MMCGTLKSGLEGSGLNGKLLCGNLKEKNKSFTGTLFFPFFLKVESDTEDRHFPLNP